MGILYHCLHFVLVLPKMCFDFKLLRAKRQHLLFLELWTMASPGAFNVSTDMNSTCLTEIRNTAI